MARPCWRRCRLTGRPSIAVRIYDMHAHTTLRYVAQFSSQPLALLDHERFVLATLIRLAHSSLCGVRLPLLPLVAPPFDQAPPHCLDGLVNARCSQHPLLVGVRCSPNFMLLHRCTCRVWRPCLASARPSSGLISLSLMSLHMHRGVSPRKLPLLRFVLLWSWKRSLLPRRIFASKCSADCAVMFVELLLADNILGPCRRAIVLALQPSLTSPSPR